MNWKSAVCVLASVGVLTAFGPSASAPHGPVAGHVSGPSLNAVFFSDSGPVAVEVTMKMAIQYQAARGKPGKQKMLALRGGIRASFRQL